ncbi:PH domain-containing protein [Actinocatenispora comari]|jgi:membrane protein YdbS with pleckstrin-like domain
MHRDEADRSADDARRDTEPIPGMAHPPRNRADDLLGDGDSPPPSGRADIPPPIEEPVGGYTDTDDFDSATGLPNDGPRRVTSVEPEPSAYVARYLFPTEKYRGEWRRHWIHIIVPIIVLIVATFLMGFVSSLLAHYKADIAVTVVVLLWVLSLIWVGWRTFDWFQDRFILTNKRVMLINGLITRKVAMMPLLRVTDMKYQQSPLGRMLNYGTFVLESAGQDQALREVPHLPNPNELYLRVVEEMYEPEAVEARLGESESDGSDA